MSGQYLGEAQFQKVAQWVRALSRDTSVLGAPGYFQGTRADWYKALSSNAYRLAWSELTQIGYLKQAQGTGPEGFRDILTLRYLVGKGRIDPADADAFLRQKYPEQVWAGGEWGKSSGSLLNQVATDQSTSIAGATNQQLAQIASGPTSGLQAPFSGSIPSGAAAIQPITIDELGTSYDQERVTEVLQSFASQVSAQMSAVASGRALMLGPGVVDGTALAPGSVPATALAADALSSQAGQLPGPEQAIELLVGRANDLDRWSTSGGVTGPGRIWRANATVYPAGFKPTLGPQRYRIPLTDLRFGVMSILMRTDSWNTNNKVDKMEVRYGLVITDIPCTTLRRPAALRLFSYEHEAPSALVYNFSDAGFPGAWTGTNRFMDARADQTWRVTGKPGWSSFGSDAKLSPSAATVHKIAGLTAMLISGQNSEDVFEQLCSRQTFAGASILGAGHGQSASIPPGIAPSSPTPPSAIEWDGNDPVAHYSHLTETAAAASQRLVEGVPFTFDDCSRLRALTSSFSIALEVSVVQTVSVAGTWLVPALWQQSGLQALKANDRDWTVDLIVE